MKLKLNNMESVNKIVFRANPLYVHTHCEHSLHTLKMNDLKEVKLQINSSVFSI